jgi:hypothetical protein
MWCGVAQALRRGLEGFAARPKAVKTFSLKFAKECAAKASDKECFAEVRQTTSSHSDCCVACCEWLVRDRY